MASRLPVFITCALLSCGVGAAELGEPRISSYIGQPLVLELELTALASPATPVAARLARPDVYRGANIGMPPVLSTLAMRVSQRDGRQFLRVTSSAPVESSRLHLYLELADGGEHDVRLVTLFIAPNPNPNPPAPAVPVPVPPSVPVPAPMPVPVPVNATTPLAADLPAAPVAASRPKAVVKPAPPKLPKPPKPPKPLAVAKATPTPAPEPEPASAAQATAQASTPLPKPLPVSAPASAPAATCAPSSADSAPVCAALDVKNALLREQIGTLEDKVRVLQVALGANPSAVVQDKVAKPATSRPSRKRPAPEPEASTPWGWIGGAVVAVLVLVGGVLVLLRRRKRAGPMIQPMPRMSMMARLRQRFARKKKVPAPVEPQLDEPHNEMSTQL
ncbi:hypothetical protein IFT68_03050 [Oxalobacteraceae sp. CFBP 13730]|nr:hypothetical protein [Oxalobacteraceae sp. CFBP 13730]